ncbi:50S ribosomal protein Mrp49 [Talaromyces stipitatus ATCC 10500]|uniref:50S ribosomal protein Mrp49 n=1 Tax=Talaromyces stipitatus (strain ATCC 10500 / CBS 375.48 / QM 6759 / NRRL 1006) TaxID=441959 RepID=B8MAM6_TALSN|nr:50S ribosomal protein Mrp49 [Talaromyces stipitatus ATCC 10500]EED17450.1 50S ribosomal protein Mrp49 [Talaromyces stipitatus ATCC 10500]
MVNLFKRMRKLNHRLINVRVGTGAATLPSISSPLNNLPAVTRMHLTYGKSVGRGHIGAQKFWRKCLLRLKYYNPAIQMTVKPYDGEERHAALTIFFSGVQPQKAQAYHDASIKDEFAPSPTESEKAVVLNLKDYNFEEIWQQVKELTGAVEVEPTAEDKEQLEKFRQMDIKSEADRIRVAGIRQAKKDQERMLQEARGEVEKLREL